MRFFSRSIAIFALISAPMVTNITVAQNLDIPVPLGQQGNASISVPSLGMSKDYVQQQFGNPNSQRGPVGEPPISTWEYDAFTVYFEYNVVIHAVLTHSPQQ